MPELTGRQMRPLIEKISDDLCEHEAASAITIAIAALAHVMARVYEHDGEGFARDACRTPVRLLDLWDALND